MADLPLINPQEVEVVVASHAHEPFAERICDLIAESAKARRTGIAKREPSYIRSKMAAGNAVGAVYQGMCIGFCYVEVWTHGRYVANSGLIVDPDYRGLRLAERIKTAAFNLARDKYPDARVFGITTNGRVMEINSNLGYRPCTFSQLTLDDTFWSGCQSCPNYDILQRNERKMCLCTAMVAPSKNEAKAAKAAKSLEQAKKKLEKEGKKLVKEEKKLVKETEKHQKLVAKVKWEDGE